jgi:hypothetical protein
VQAVAGLLHQPLPEAQEAGIGKDGFVAPGNGLARLAGRRRHLPILGIFALLRPHISSKESRRSLSHMISATARFSASRSAWLRLSVSMATSAPAPLTFCLAR